MLTRPGLDEQGLRKRRWGHSNAAVCTNQPSSHWKRNETKQKRAGKRARLNLNEKIVQGQGACRDQIRPCVGSLTDSTWHGMAWHSIAWPWSSHMHRRDARVATCLDLLRAPGLRSYIVLVLCT